MKRILIALGAVLALLTMASSASASVFHPTGEYAQFGECPLARPALNACVYSETTKGSFTLGKKTVPIVKPVILQGGIEGEAGTFVPAANPAETLTKVPQPVPGGLLGVTAPAWWPQFLRDLFNETINNGFTGVTATVELAGPASAVKISIPNISEQSGTGLSLPVKIKLSNPFLGNNCYIGSDSKPIVIDFTSGTTSPPPPNTPITGSAGTISINGAGTIITASGGRLVNNTFAAPGASGCGGLFSFLIDPFVNSIVGVPSPSGTNTAILEGKVQLASAPAVKASE